MTGEFYVGILQDRLPEMKRMLGRRWRFQQDNDPKHTSRVAKKFLGENIPEVIDWPANSPDLNPIENLWGIVKNNVKRRMPADIDDLQVYLKEEWEKIAGDTLINLIKSMPNRYQAIIDSNGERIGY